MAGVQGHTQRYCRPRLPPQPLSGLLLVCRRRLLSPLISGGYELTGNVRFKVLRRRAGAIRPQRRYRATGSRSYSALALYQSSPTWSSPVTDASLALLVRRTDLIGYFPAFSDVLKWAVLPHPARPKKSGMRLAESSLEKEEVPSKSSCVLLACFTLTSRGPSRRLS